MLQRTLKKDFPLDPQGIRYLSIENDNCVPYDLVMLLGLHSIWKSRMAVRHAEVDARPVSDYFCVSLRNVIEVWKAQVCCPDWVPVLEEALPLKPF